MTPCICVCRIHASGETGVGKSTLMDTLFNTKFEGDPTKHSQPSVQLRSSTYQLQESNVRLKLTVVNTVGFGDQINKEERWVSQQGGLFCSLGFWQMFLFISHPQSFSQTVYFIFLLTF